VNPRRQSERRRGSQAVEAAIVFPVLMFLLLALIVGGIGVFRYQQVALLSQEASRWAGVRGADFQKDADAPSPTQAQILQQAVLPLAVGMDPSSISLQVQWIDQGNAKITDWDSAPKYVKSQTPGGDWVTNTVRVTVTYQWSPGLLVGPLTLTSCCEGPMSE
jgi:Flp pilus assembly protein TadG